MKNELIFKQWIAAPSDVDERLSNGLYLLWFSQGDLRHAYDVETEDGLLGLLFWIIANAKDRFGWIPYLPEAALSWLEESVEEISRLQLIILKSREDLRAAFENKNKVDGSAYLAWFAERFKIEYPESFDYLETSKADLKKTATEKRWGNQRKEYVKKAAEGNQLTINVVGYFRGQLGIGEDARMLYRALLTAGHRVNAVDVSDWIMSEKAESIPDQDGGEVLYTGGITIFCSTAYDNIALLFKFGPDIFVESHTIGYWPWELSKWVPEWNPVLQLVDRVWASSAFLENIYIELPGVEVQHIPLVVEYDALPLGTKADFDLGSDFTFLFIFDGLSYMDRKNPILHVRAFKTAFQNGEEVRLVIKTMNGQHSSQRLWQQLLKEIEGDERITLINKTYPKEMLLRLYDAVDAYISLHRAEGFGRTLIEAMLYGKPVIASRYSGNLDYCNENNSALVDGVMIPVESGEYPFSTDQEWFSPSIESAAASLRKVYFDPVYRKEIAAQAKQTAALYSSQHIAKNYLARYIPSSYEINALLVSNLLDIQNYKNKTGVAGSDAFVVAHYLLNWKEGVEISKYFDSQYYLGLYDDVLASGNNPLLHYIWAGAAEGRNPNPYFDSAFYRRTYPDVAAARVEPLLHYVSQGWKEKRQPNQSFNIEIFSTIESFYRNSCPLDFLLERRPPIGLYASRPVRLPLPSGRTSPAILSTPVDVIVPVYNGLNFLKDLVESLYLSDEQDFNLIFVEDKSSDPEVVPYLKELQQKHKNIKVVFHETNTGFPAAVLTGYRYVSSSVFVLLNSDTVVPKKWLVRITAPFFADSKIASATPFSNSATIFSFPKPQADNALLSGFDINAVDAAFSSLPLDDYEDVPTGVGFCMALRKSIVDEIGFFNAELFGRGYGEENDWCLRAYLAGYRNVAVPNLFVMHVGTASFTQCEKQAAVIHATTLLQEKYPFYNRWIEQFTQLDPLRKYRYQALLNLMAKDGQAILLIDHSASGGTNLYADNKLRGWLNEGRTIVKLGSSLDESRGYGAVYYQGQVFAIEVDYSTFGSFLKKGSFGRVVINSLVFNIYRQSIIRDLVDYKNDNPDVNISYLLHDYFSICPSYTLLNNEGKYCSVPDISICRTCIVTNKANAYNLAFSEISIDAWRKTWSDLLDACDQILVFSDSSKEILLRAYPDTNKKIIIRPHTVEKKNVKIQRRRVGDELHVAFVGWIFGHKGANIAIEMSTIAHEKKLPLKFSVFGSLEDPEKKFIGNVTGPYGKDALPLLFEKYQADLAFLPFIWPETFSYLTQELIELDIPVGVFDIGAPAERVKHYTKGFIIQDVSAQAALAGIMEYLKTTIVKNVEN